DIGGAGQDGVDLRQSPTPSVAGEEAALVEIGGDGLYAHRAGRAVSFEEQAIDQPHGVGVQRVDLQLLLDLRSPLLGCDDAIADGRPCAVPEALPGVLVHGTQDVLGVLLRLVFVEQRHDLPHHLVHRIVAHLLPDGTSSISRSQSMFEQGTSQARPFNPYAPTACGGSEAYSIAVSTRWSTQRSKHRRLPSSRMWEVSLPVPRSPVSCP